MDSIGGSALVTLIGMLNQYFSRTFAVLADSFYEIGVIFVTLYIVIMGYLALKGKVGDSVGHAAMLIFTVPICFLIFFNIGYFKDWVFQPIFSTMLDLMGIGIGSSSSFSFADIFKTVDESFADIFTAVDRITNQMDTWDIGLQVKVFFVSGLIGLVFAVLYAVFSVLIITSIFSLYVMMVLAPIFGTFAAFKPTRSIFFNWLKVNITYALVPVFTAIVMGITIVFIQAAVQDISNINVVEDGIFTKAVGSALFVGLLSIFLHMKAPEYASGVTGSQISGVGGFFGAVGGIAAAGVAGASALGGGTLAKKAGNLRDAGYSKVAGYAADGVKNAYSRLRGFDN